jgi:hypothetical protein
MFVGTYRVLRDSINIKASVNFVMERSVDGAVNTDSEILHLHPAQKGARTWQFVVGDKVTCPVVFTQKAEEETCEHKGTGYFRRHEI